MAMVYAPIVQQLVDKMASDPEFSENLASSFALAVRAAPEFAERGITTLDAFVAFMDEFLHWVPTETASSKNVNVLMCMWYFVLDLPPVCAWQNAIQPSERAPWRWLSQWIIDYAQEMGAWMDTPASLTPRSLKTFYTAPGYRIAEYADDPGWTTFNQFFARRFKDIDRQRPVAAPQDDRVVVSPADCKYGGSWRVDERNATITAKGIEWAIAQLLDGDGSLFAGGVFAHGVLDTTDYHRVHAPVRGTVVDARVVPGLCYCEIVLLKDDIGKPNLAMRRFMLREEDMPEKQRAVPLVGGDTPARHDVVTPNSTGYQFLQARGIVLIDNPVLGLVAVLPIGMAQISSVVLSVKPGDKIQKGDEIGYFQMGGSDVVMVFQKGANVKFEQEIDQWYKVRSHIATGGGA